MLTKKDKEKIIKLREQGYSYEAIHEKLGFSPDTVMKVCKAEEERKIKEAGEKKRENERARENQVPTMEMYSGSAEEGIRSIVANIKYLLKSKRLEVNKRKELELILEGLQEMLRSEVDERIFDERADAVVKRDAEWNITIKQHYVKKEVAVNLENTINSKDATIDQLRNEIGQRDATIINKQDEISQLNDFYQREIWNLKDQIGKLVWDNNELINDNWRMHNIIQDYSAEYEQREQEYKRRDWELKGKEVKLKNSFIEVDKKFEEIARINKQQTEQAEKLTKRENEFNIQIKNVYDDLNKKITSVINHEKEVNESANELLIQKKELAAEKNKIDDYKEKQMEEIKNEKEKISKKIEEMEKTKAELEIWEQRLKKQQSLEKNRDYYKDSPIQTIYRVAKLVGVKGQKPSGQYKSVTLYPINQSGFSPNLYSSGETKGSTKKDRS